MFFRFASEKAIPKMNIVNNRSVRIDSGSENALGASGYISVRKASTPYVNGLIYISARIHPEAPERGNSAPESSHRGIRKRLMIAWNDCVESIGHAMAKPSAVNANEPRRTVSTIRPNVLSVR